MKNNLISIFLAYGNIFFPGATLMFDVELIHISDQPPTTNVFKEIDLNTDNQLSREEVSKMARLICFYSSRGLGILNLAAWSFSILNNTIKFRFSIH